MANAPLVEIMVTIRDQSMDLGIMADWLGTPPYGTIENTKKYLMSSEKRLRECYDQIKALTGLDPCK